MVIGLGVWVTSAGLDLFDRIQHWGKLVHAVDCLCVAALFGALLLGYREVCRVEVADQLVALLSACAGFTFGVAWEFVEFVIDWVTYADHQKSNTDTMTDLLWSAIGTVLGAYLAMRTPRSQRAPAGVVAVQLAQPLGRWLGRHGAFAGSLVLVIMAAAVVALWFSGRPVPGFGRD